MLSESFSFKWNIPSHSNPNLWCQWFRGGKLVTEYSISNRWSIGMQYLNPPRLPYDRERIGKETTLQPKDVEIFPDSIKIHWNDDHVSIYPHRYLRLNCRCASCIGEWPNKGTLDSSSIREDVIAVEHQTVGLYALQFLWSDTHYTGIYPYTVLRELCLCPECGGSGGDGWSTTLPLG